MDRKKSLPGPLLGPKKIHALSTRIKDFLDSNPDAKLTDIMRATGCAKNMASIVRRKWLLVASRPWNSPQPLNANPAR